MIFSSLPFRDSQGTPIEKGCTVAYNLSGIVALGKVEEIKQRSKAPFRIRLIKEAAGCYAGHISKVRHPDNMLVLLDPNGIEVLW